MDKRHSKKHSNWNNQKGNSQKNNNQQQPAKNPNQNQSQTVENKNKGFQFNHTVYENEETKREKQKAIQEVKAREITCPKCGNLITDVASAFADKNTGAPVHFECVLKEIEASEKLNENEKIAYIGQGRFGILYYENPRDARKFTIKKIIEWENKENKNEWREELSGLYSHID